jgi:hypothetical protein
MEESRGGTADVFVGEGSLLRSVVVDLTGCSLSPLSEEMRMTSDIDFGRSGKDFLCGGCNSISEPDEISMISIAGACFLGDLSVRFGRLE